MEISWRGFSLPRSPCITHLAGRQERLILCSPTSTPLRMLALRDSSIVASYRALILGWRQQHSELGTAPLVAWQARAAIMQPPESHQQASCFRGLIDILWLMQSRTSQIDTIRGNKFSASPAVARFRVRLTASPETQLYPRVNGVHDAPAARHVVQAMNGCSSLRSAQLNVPFAATYLHTNASSPRY